MDRSNIFFKLIHHGNIEKNFHVMNNIFKIYWTNPKVIGSAHVNRSVLISKMRLNVNGVIIKIFVNGVKKKRMNSREKSHDWNEERNSCSFSSFFHRFVMLNIVKKTSFSVCSINDIPRRTSFLTLLLDGKSQTNTLCRWFQRRSRR